MTGHSLLAAPECLLALPPIIARMSSQRVGGGPLRARPAPAVT